MLLAVLLLACLFRSTDLIRVDIDDLLADRDDLFLECAKKVEMVEMEFPAVYVVFPSVILMSCSKASADW